MLKLVTIQSVLPARFSGISLITVKIAAAIISHMLIRCFFVLFINYSSHDDFPCPVSYCRADTRYGVRCADLLRPSERSNAITQVFCPF